MRPLRLGFILSLGAWGLSACTNPAGPDDPRQVLAQNRQRFRSVVGPSYRVDYQQLCFCPTEIRTPVRLTVRQGRIVDVEPLSTEDALPPESWHAYRTVEGVFDAIDAAYERGARRVTATYHKDQGYPTEVDIDDRREVDAWEGFKLGNLSPLR